MKANELRIGNWILPKHDLDGKYHQVKELTKSAINNYIAEWYSCIPLTPEILEKCGFKVDEDINFYGKERHIFYSLNGSFIICYRKEVFSKWINVDEDYFYSFSQVDIKYLHQLQNLYFALTGEELTVNLSEPVSLNA